MSKLQWMIYMHFNNSTLMFMSVYILIEIIIRVPLCVIL